jgi:uncharacterized protein YecT (DUF1311 family)
VVASFALAGAQATSFDCSKAQSKVEKLICDTPQLSDLDDKLGQTYRDVLAKASGEHKQLLVNEQRHWLKFTRNVCQQARCLKHAYFARQAALETYSRPIPPVYAKESDKAQAVQQILANSPLYPLIKQPFCNRIFDDLKQMKDIRFVDPVVQTLSYEDPALDPWKKQCRGAPPFHFSYQCEPRLEPESADDDIAFCRARYGLPPFKLYELPPSKAGGAKRHILYVEEGYGPMNMDGRRPGFGGAGYSEIHIAQCLSARGNSWEDWSAKGEQKTEWEGVSADAGQGGPMGKNYNSVIQYQSNYYFLILAERHGNYWLDIEPTVNSQPPVSCNWTPVKK